MIKLRFAIGFFLLLACKIAVSQTYLNMTSFNMKNLDYQPASDQYQYTGYFWKKFTPLSGSDTPDSIGGNFQIDNYPVIRFSDVLLMAVELNLDTDLGKAQGYYNKVRDRAFGNTSHRLALTNNDAGKNLIFNERRLELALEGHRYWDLLRRGVAVAKSAIDDNSGGDFTTLFIFLFSCKKEL